MKKKTLILIIFFNFIFSSMFMFYYFKLAIKYTYYLDKIIRLEILRDTNNYYDTNEVTWKKLNYPGMMLIKFRKSDYSQIKSAQLVVFIRSETADLKTYVSLYDITNKTTIPNSEISTTETKWTMVESGNILNELPDGKIYLCVQYKSEDVLNSAGISTAYLILKR